MNTSQEQYDVEFPEHDKNLIPVAHYDQYNHRRYGTPWIAPFNAETRRPDFDAERLCRTGGYTGGYNTGNAGYLTIIRPRKTVVYAYGQKDHRSSVRGGYNIAIVSPEGDVVTMTKQEYFEKAFVAIPAAN